MTKITKTAGRIGILVVSFVIAVVIIVGLYKLWQPVAEWYWNQIPARGIDLFNSVTYASYLMKHFSLPANGWKYIWYSGEPWGRDYPYLYYYFMVPLVRIYGLVRGVQIFALGSMFACVAFSYLLFAVVSKNRILAGILALAVGYSVNMYKGLVYAGGIPVYATQAFFPLVLYVIFKYLQTNNRRYLLLAGLLSGLGIIGHPQHFVNFVFPSVTLLLVFSYYSKRYFALTKIKDLVIYFVVSLLVGIPELFGLAYDNFIIPIFQPVTKAASAQELSHFGISPQIIEWAKRQFFFSFSDTNSAFIQLIIICLVLGVVGLIIGRYRVKAILNTLAIALVAGWAIYYIYLLSIGINIYQGGWEAWYKLFWTVPIVLGLLASQLYSVFAESIPSRLKNIHLKNLAPIVIETGFGVVFLFLAAYFFNSYTKDFTQKLTDVSAFSSTFPEALGGSLSDEDLAKFKAQAKPSFLEDSPKNYRLYSADQTLNLWWSSLFDTPLARGYIDPPVEGVAGRWGLFWMDSAFGKGKNGGASLVDDWKNPESVVENNVAYLLDWNAIKYIEGNHLAHENYGRLGPIVTSAKFIQSEEEPTVQGGIVRAAKNPEIGTWDESRTQQLHFYEVKDNLVTPIHYATNAPAVLLIGGGDSFDIVIRDAAMLGLTSKDLIVAKGPQFIDDVSTRMLKDFDAVILYKYDYRNQSGAWGKIASYLQDGGKVFVDTGGEVKESSTVDLPDKYSKTLPDIFPIKQTKRGDLGNSWDSEGTGDMFNGIGISTFSDLKFDNGPWNISYPPNKTDDLSDGAKVLLTLQGYPVMAEKEIGSGLLIWSGINLPYHALYNFNMNEAKVFSNTLTDLMGSSKNDLISSKVQWISPEKRIISAPAAKGVLVKEEIHPGWSASVTSENGSSGLPIYTVGPTSPGYMYVRIPANLQGNSTTVTIVYNGSFNSWIPSIISLVTILIVADIILFNNMLFGIHLKTVKRRIKKKMDSWWEKEE